ncbi:MAG: M50 family metallopeptidase [Kiritimatiellae bacterium]|nr:M50 family metallopeptidase [Kiritimatiellia bacterium]
MFPRKIKVCDAFGIPVYLDFSLIILLILFVMDFGSFVYGLSFAMALALSIVAHELGHALTARMFGCHARDITLSLIGGCASLISLPRKPWQEFLTALMGPAISFLISGVAWFAFNFLPVPDHWTANVLYYTMWMNLMLGGFNLLPGFPMDGGRIFRSVASIFTTRTKATYCAMVLGRVVAILLGLKGLHSVVSGGGWGFITILIAWMIWREGWREYQLARMEESARSEWSGWRAHVSPPPYGGDDEEVEIRKDR